MTIKMGELSPCGRVRIEGDKRFILCPKCKYLWMRRAKKPKECPQCKTRLWRKNEIK
jgi:rubrerythrin